MNFNNLKYDHNRNNSQTKQLLITEGIKQAWYRRFSSNIHSGVRVKIQQKNISSYIEPIHQNQTNHIQPMLQRLYMKSKNLALTQKSSDKFSHLSPNQTYEIKSISNNNLYHHNHSVENHQIMNSIGIQTVIITKIDRETSCDILTRRKKHIKKISSTSSLSSTETSISDENSTSMVTTSTELSTTNSTTTMTNPNNHFNERYQRYKNRNNNATETDVEPKNLSTDDQILHEIDIHTQCHPSTNTKQPFFRTFLNLFSYLRLSSSSKNDRISTSTSNIMNRKHNKTISTPTSRCRRSATRNFNNNSSIAREKSSFEEETLSKRNHVEQQTSMHSLLNKSLLIEEQDQPFSNSRSSIVDSQQSKRHKIKHSYKKESHTRRHRKKRKYIRQSNKTSQMALTSIRSSPIELQLSSSTDKIVEKENITSIILDNIKQPSFIHTIDDSKQETIVSLDNQSNEIVPCLRNNENTISNILPSTFQKLLNDNKQCKTHARDSVHLRVRNRNLILNLSKSKLTHSSCYNVDDSIRSRQKNLIQEFKSIVQQVNHNNNSFADNSKIHTKKMLTAKNSNIELKSISIKNRNDNNRESASITSSDNSIKPIGDNSVENQEKSKDQNAIIREGIEQLIRYQKLSQSYKLTSNKPVRDFLMKSMVLSTQSLYKLSVMNEPNSIIKSKENLKQTKFK